ncbi:hypothetical protein E2562_021808 [Oryza meyeriana var. granulata]|uniref:Uncharacterized protein n=1 Tax=Oryza meyeriana var. granulata TaxID=110450 RepID=A0A6G1EN89_9ORYZ|nr:hypothetical protein E2562_021808 [Oryza meyeriana var. granulata]
MELMVWDTITGDQHHFPQPPHPHAYCAGAVLCAARDCHHLDCHQGPFLVVFVGSGDDSENDSWACLYSSETGQWSSPASIVFDSYVEMLPSLLIDVEDTLYFICEHGMWYVDYAGNEEWEESRVIELDMLIPLGNPSFSRHLVGFAEGTDTIFVLSDVGLFAIELKSGQVKKVGERRPYYAVIPYMSFYTSGTEGMKWTAEQRRFLAMEGKASDSKLKELAR